MILLYSRKNGNFEYPCENQNRVKISNFEDFFNVVLDDLNNDSNTYWCDVDDFQLNSLLTHLRKNYKGE